MKIHRTHRAFDEYFIQRALLHEFFVSIFFGGNLNITISFTCLEVRPTSGGKSPPLRARPNCERSPGNIIIFRLGGTFVDFSTKIRIFVEYSTNCGIFVEYSTNEFFP